jgi:hypothetical protein
MYIGWLCGTDNFAMPALARKLIRQVYQEFEKEYGTVLCKDVRPKVSGDYTVVVARAAQWTAEALLGQFADGQENGL